MRGVSLFANVGIAETYLGTGILVANELLDNRARFHKEMHPHCHMVQGDITDPMVYDRVRSLAITTACDFLLATPPCQGMSGAGLMQEDDPRNSLIKYVVKMIQDLEPRNALIENVPEILKTYIFVDGVKTLVTDYIAQELPQYFINYKVVNAADYGTPQSRKRAIFLLCLRDPWEFPATQPVTTVRDAIGHLPSLERGEYSGIEFHNAKEHNGRHVLAMKHTPTGKTAHINPVHFPKKVCGERAKGYATTYKRIEWDKPSPTITMANGSISSQNNVHPGRELLDGTYSDARVLTLKEIFILTGLPDDWEPPEWASDNMIRQVIGEGVPPRLIEALTRGI